MDKFTKKVKTRRCINKGLALIGVALIVLNRFFGESIGYSPVNSDPMIDSRGFSLGLICVLIAGLVFHIIKDTYALRDEEKLKKLFIAESDERALLILQKSGSIGMNASMVGLVISASVSAHFNTTVFFTLLGACLFVSLIRGFLKLYYRNKY